MRRHKLGDPKAGISSRDGANFAHNDLFQGNVVAGECDLRSAAKSFDGFDGIGVQEPVDDKNKNLSRQLAQKNWAFPRMKSRVS
jgi:hypothetical protein